MRLSKFLKIVESIAQSQGISTPFVCGGLPRDKVLNIANQLNDIDITTGDAGARSLAKEIAFRMPSVAQYIELPGKHTRVYLGSLKLDFSTNFRIKNIDAYLEKIGVEPTDLMQELYSRDFTCNSLLMEMDLKTIHDPTTRGVPDIQKKIIDTNLDPKITIGVDPKRAIRAVYLSSKLSFKLSERLEQYLLSNKEIFAQIDAEYLTKKIIKSLSYNKELTVNFINIYDLWKFLLPSPEINQILIENHKG